MRFPLKPILVLGLCTLSGTAAAEPPRPRFDPPDQLFRRAPMAESSRSVVVNLSTNLHLAFDAEKCRVHTVWQGRGLELWGPPYHGAKTPFICTVAGDRVWSFPGLVPWSTRRGGETDVQYGGFKTTGGKVRFLYDLMDGSRRIEIEERPYVSEGAGSLVFAREFKVGPADAELRFLAHAELAGQIELEGAGVRIRAGGRSYLIESGGEAGVTWEAVEEQVDYSFERITNEGTEKGNPREKRRGLEARAYARIPAHDGEVRFSVRITLESVKAEAEDMTLAMKESRPKIFTAAEETREPGGDEFYTIEHFPVPPEIELLVTGMDWLNEEDLAVCTWVGEIYIVEGAAGDPARARYRRFARGLNEPLGLALHEGQMYVVQKGELTRISDTDGDGKADLFACVNDDWGYSGNYHSYSFGPVIDEDENFYVFTTGQRARWDLPFQGYGLRISPDGEEIEPVCHGLRAPNGFGSYRGDIFYVDNQGNWVGACKLSQVVPGQFHGFPSSRPAPKGERRGKEEVQAPAVWFPRSLAPSSSGMETISDGRFGPFEGQLLVGDFQNAIVTRVFLEKVNGKWQGAVFPFARGFLSGVNRLRMGPDGKMYVGGVKRTWSAAAPLEYSLDRVSFTGETPFEVKEVRATENGFELEFTKPVNRADAADPENYGVSQFRYRYHEDYGSPQFDHEGNPGETTLEIVKAEVGSDGTAVRLEVEGLRPGFVTTIQLPLVMSEEGNEIRHDTFWYTLNDIPGEADLSGAPR